MIPGRSVSPRAPGCRTRHSPLLAGSYEKQGILRGYFFSPSTGITPLLSLRHSANHMTSLVGLSSPLWLHPPCAFFPLQRPLYLLLSEERGPGEFPSLVLPPSLFLPSLAEHRMMLHRVRHTAAEPACAFPTLPYPAEEFRKTPMRGKQLCRVKLDPVLNPGPNVR